MMTRREADELAEQIEQIKAQIERQKELLRTLEKIADEMHSDYATEWLGG